MNKYDAVVIGSGFGGTMAARQLAAAGMKVLMIERGGWVQRGPENWGPRGSVDLSPHYDKTSPLHVVAGGNKKQMGLYACVGGPSVFYGGVAFRFREADFAPNEQIEGKNAEGWPLSYRDLEPFYTEVERLLNVSGESGVDPTEPPRQAPFPQAPPPLAAISQKVKCGAEKLGLHPFALPLAINYTDAERATCRHCKTCDTFACAVGAKNDLATVLLPSLLVQNTELRTDTVVTKLVVANKRLSGVECVSKQTRQTAVYAADTVVLAAGAMASPHLLLASGLQHQNPGGHVIGRYLMRHLNAIVFGVFPGTADREGRFHKQLAILDYYFGHPAKKGFTKLGSLQQMPTPPAALVQNEIGGAAGRWLSKSVRLLSGLLAIAEDQPQASNAITLNEAQRDVYGLPQAVVTHRYSERDVAALNALTGAAKKIMYRAGAFAHYVHHIRTFSHAVGTVRMGHNPQTSALDANGRFRGLENLYVTDASVMPTSAALNPSLTIAANALRIGQLIAKR